MITEQQESAIRALLALTREADAFGVGAAPLFASAGWTWIGTGGVVYVPTAMDIAALARSLVWDIVRGVQRPTWDGEGTGVGSGRIEARLIKGPADAVRGVLYSGALSVVPYQVRT